MILTYWLGLRLLFVSLALSWMTPSFWIHLVWPWIRVQGIFNSLHLLLPMPTQLSLVIRPWMRPPICLWLWTLLLVHLPLSPLQHLRWLLYPQWFLYSQWYTIKILPCLKGDSSGGPLISLLVHYYCWRTWWNAQSYAMKNKIQGLTLSDGMDPQTHQILLMITC